LIPLALAAREAGHEVGYAAHPDFHPILEKFGLEVIAAGLSIPEAFGGAIQGSGLGPDATPEQLAPVTAKVFGEVLPSSFVADLKAVVGQYDLVIPEMGNFGARLAATLAGVPVLAQTFGRSSSDFMGLIENDLRAYATSLGVSIPDGQLETFGGPCLDICPASLQEPDFVARVERIEVRPIPFTEPGPAAAAPAKGDRPLVYLTLGTSMSDTGALRQAIDGLSTLDVDVLVASGPLVEVDDLGEIPANVTVLPWVRQSEVYEHIDLIVHQGGSGTGLGAAAAGVPMLLLPQGADQFGNAGAFADAGAGIRLMPDECSLASIAAGASQVLQEEKFRVATGELAEQIAAMPTPQDIVPRLADFR
jgi:UDP:flavonoid glycosyltransferase YjiC (YdhE family)